MPTKIRRKKRQVFAVYWETDGHSSMINPIKAKTPDTVKKMIVQSLLDDLGIRIRII